jgi:hypothetical protein
VFSGADFILPTWRQRRSGAGGGTSLFRKLGECVVGLCARRWHCLWLRAGMLSAMLPFARVLLMLSILLYFEHRADFV